MPLGKSAERRLAERRVAERRALRERGVRQLRAPERAPRPDAAAQTAGAQTDDSSEDARRLSLKERMLVVKRRQVEGNARIALVLTVVIAAVLAGWGFVEAKSMPEQVKYAAQDPRAAFDSEDDVFSAAFVGDVMLGRDIAPKAQRFGYDALFSRTKWLWEDADYVFGNLECTLVGNIDNYTEAEKEEHIYASDEAAPALASAGFTIMQLANNHTVDYGAKGVLHTLKSLDEAGIAAVGAGRGVEAAQTPVESAFGGFSVKTFAVSDVVPPDAEAGKKSTGILTFDNSDIYQTLSDARGTADLIVVGAHWGVEYARESSEAQRSQARSLIDAGADIVIGSHSHVLEPIELYHGGIIFYGLGNFVGDDAWSRGRDSVVVRYTVKDDGTSAFTVRPLRISGGVPEPTDSSLFQARAFATLTRMLAQADYAIEGGVMTIPFKTFDKVAFEAPAPASATGAGANPNAGAGASPNAGVTTNPGASPNAGANPNAGTTTSTNANVTMNPGANPGAGSAAG